MVLREIEERRMEITKHLTDGVTQPRSVLTYAVTIMSLWLISSSHPKK